MRKTIPRIKNLEQGLIDYKASMILTHRQLSHELSKNMESFRMEQRILLDTIGDEQKKLAENFHKKQSSVDTLTNMMYKLNKESHLTDFYLDKILPV